MLRSFAAASAAVALLAGGAGAEEAIPTAKGTTPPAASTEPPPPLDPSSGAAELPPRPGPCGSTKTVVGSDGQPHADQSPHGEVTVGVGNHGYREVGAVVCKPMGDNSALIVSVNAGRVGSRR